MDHGLNLIAVVTVTVCVVVWGLTSARLTRWNLTAPIVFVTVGVVTANGPWAFVHLRLHSSTILSLVEVTLALVLFSDASRVNVHALRGSVGVPLRLLGLGLPLAIGIGTAVAFGLLGVSAWVAAVIAAAVAPTDAALGAEVMEDPRVPGMVRLVLNVESGLNDGIATPFVNLFLAGALVSESISTAGVGQAAVDLVGGTALGLAVGAGSGALVLLSERRRWSVVEFRSLAIVAVAVLSYAAALQAGVNGFVAAFVAGAGYGSMARRTADRGATGELRFVEDVSELLSLLVWYVFGAVMVVPGLRAATWGDVAFAVSALNFVRMVPVAVVLIGSRLTASTVAFIGWMGPRGLASVVFGLLAVDSLDPPAAHATLGAVAVTVTLSVLVHGVTARPLAARYRALGAPGSRRPPARARIGAEAGNPRVPGTRP